jgi:hypothetical protein
MTVLSKLGAIDHEFVGNLIAGAKDEVLRKFEQQEKTLLKASAHYKTDTAKAICENMEKVVNLFHRDIQNIINMPAIRGHLGDASLALGKLESG